jgi:hypothetical protein
MVAFSIQQEFLSSLRDFVAREKNQLLKRGEAAGWTGKVSRRDTMRKIITSPGSSAILSGSFKRFRAVTFGRSDSGVPCV